MRTLVIPDVHAPFNHPSALDFLAALKRAYKPHRVVCIGDLGDQHGWSRHERQPDAPGQHDEDEACLAVCRGLYHLFPRVHACIGNHDMRLAKRAIRAGIPSRLHRSIGEIYESPKGWEWADRHVIEGVVYQHGDGFSGKDAALKAALSNRLNTAMGHIHSNAGVIYSAGPFSTIWGLAVGCLVNVSAPAFAYAKSTAAKPVLGAAIVEDGVPHFVPFQ